MKDEPAVAREVAREYRALLRVHTKGYGGSNWNLNNVEGTRWWDCFLKAGKACLELGADPKDYVQAQFNRFAWKPHAVPFPNQLYSEGALAAWAEYASKQVEKEHRKILAKRVVIHDPDDREERKLKSWSEKMQVSKRHVLRHYPTEFSPSFLKKHGIHSSERGVE